MKHFIKLFLALAIVTSCAVLQPTERTTDAFYIDYRHFTSNDFFLSPDPYPEKFKPIAELRVEVTPAVKKYKPITTSAYADGIYQQNKSIYHQENISMRELLDAIVTKAKELNANGIVNLKIKQESNKIIISKGLFKDKTLTVNKYIITGFCIKR